MKKNALKLFETKTTTLTHGVNVIKVEPADNDQLDLLVTILEQRFSDGWNCFGITASGPYLIYTLEKDFGEEPEDEPWKG